jgi:hypothetical protein
VSPTDRANVGGVTRLPHSIWALCPERRPTSGRAEMNWWRRSGDPRPPYAPPPGRRRVRASERCADGRCRWSALSVGSRSIACTSETARPRHRGRRRPVLSLTDLGQPLRHDAPGTLAPFAVLAGELLEPSAESALDALRTGRSAVALHRRVRPRRAPAGRVCPMRRRCSPRPCRPARPISTPPSSPPSTGTACVPPSKDTALHPPLVP